MKLGSLFLALVCLTLMGSLASATPTPQQVAPPGDVSPLPPAQASPDCPTAELPFLAPAPSERSASPCGACSDTACQGKELFGFCAYRSGKVYTCYDFGQTCSGTTAPKCTCYLNIP